MSVMLSMTDNGDGTGGVATVAGDVGETDAITIYRTPYSGSEGALVSTVAATGTGPGTYSVEGSGLYYLWQARIYDPISLEVQLSPIVVQSLTNGLSAPHERVMQSVATRIQSLNLYGLGGGVKRVKTLDRQQRPKYPGILITSVNQAERIEYYTNARDTTIYPVAVMLLEQNANDFRTEPRLFNWRHKIFTAFHGQRLPGVAECNGYVTVEPGNVIEAGQGYDEQVSGLILRVPCRTPRGFQAVAYMEDYTVGQNALYLD